MSSDYSETALEAYLEEALPADEMARIEQALRREPALAARLAAIHARHDAGLHSLGEIWRRHRLSCPTRQQLGSFVLGALPDELMRYVAFHLDVAGCRYCQANLADLKAQHGQPPETTEARRRRYFQSSVGYMGK